MDLKEAYLTLHRASGIEVGDKVKILRLPTSRTENGWQHSAPQFFLDLRERSVGSAGFVRIDTRGSFEVQTEIVNEATFAWPFFCLELIEKGTPPLKIGDNEVQFNDDGIKVGCQTVTKDEVKEIYKRLFD